ncbi:LPS export ABC transporter permease LptF [Tabrizicola sp.]|uniref:LPS export ABC transporter permease LptF n=1 Tax=Tabrizicola sp. TaxID=2005166 RepID=UPI002632A546|nr:LPS export ABC transporter permease LptF [Tabrizicola sp.]MDM7931022.1 LPS export ABC transporter permease LptF [Tabrizicola sp.]
MSRFDRYLLSQLLQLFGFFALVLVAVYWVNRAVGLFDQLIGDGQSALVFLEFTILTLPNAIRLVLPVAAFAASVYVVNRLMQESELVVMQATGFSAFRLARPVLYFGLVVMVMQLVLTNVLVPASQRALSARSAEISENITARFLNAGQFMHPAAGITLYIRDITPHGELVDLFLADERGQNERVTHTARKAFLVRGAIAPKLVMLDGSTQTLSRADGRLAITRFADFTLDLAGLVSVTGGGRAGLNALSTPDLLAADETVGAEIGASPAQMLEEGHSRLAAPLMAIAAPLIGFAALMLGGFSRFGLWRQMGLAVGLIIGVQLVWTWGGSVAIQTAGAWPLVYLAPLLGIALAGLILWQAQRPKHRRTERDRPEAAA